MMSQFLVNNGPLTPYMRKTLGWLEKQKPRYEHDCKKCIFIGHFNEYDLYACGKENKCCPEDDWTDMEVETVVARRSSEPGDYTSSDDFAFTSFEDEKNPLRQAMARVIYMDFKFKLNDKLSRAAWRWIIEPACKKFTTET